MVFLFTTIVEQNLAIYAENYNEIFNNLVFRFYSHVAINFIMRSIYVLVSSHCWRHIKFFVLKTASQSRSRGKNFPWSRYGLVDKKQHKSLHSLSIFGKFRQLLIRQFFDNHFRRLKLFLSMEKLFENN